MHLVGFMSPVESLRCFPAWKIHQISRVVESQADLVTVGYEI